MSGSIPAGVVTGDDYQALVQAAKDGGYALPAVNIAGNRQRERGVRGRCQSQVGCDHPALEWRGAVLCRQGYPDAFEAKVLGAVSAAQHVHLMAKRYGVWCYTPTTPTRSLSPG